MKSTDECADLTELGFDPSAPNSAATSPPTSINLDQQQLPSKSATPDVGWGGGPMLKTDVDILKQSHLAPMAEVSEGGSGSSRVGSPDKGSSLFASGSGTECGTI